MDRPIRWNAWNAEHIGRHNVSRAEAEQIIVNAKPPFPKYQGDGRWLIRGQTDDGWFLQLVFVYDPPGVIHVIHARPLTGNEKRQLRRRRRR
jgi:uncharacterized DUF497 family protein